MPAVTEAQVLSALKQVHDPDLNRDIVALGFVKNVKICDGLVGCEIELTTPACPVKDQMKKQAEDLIRALPGVTGVDVRMTAQMRGRAGAVGDILKGVKNVIAIASGKGGVGKSTVTTNIALALAATGCKIGILDADIYGPSIPGMLGTHERPRATPEGRAIPPESYGIRIMSVGMLVGEDAPTIWRGPIASRMLQQFLGAVEWGELDYLLMDLPPGTGDVQLTLTQSAPITGAVIVTTPQDVALKIAKKGLKMFQTVQVPILGIIENMAGFVCPNCNTVHDIFRRGGGEKAARDLTVPFLGSIPIDPRAVEGGDIGKPLVALDKNSPGAKAFEIVARNVAAQVSVVNFNDASITNRPQEVHLLDQVPPRINWADGVIMAYDARQLRLACPCAACRNEMTGERMLQDSDVPAQVSITAAQPVGKYGLNLVFSDGHSSGIYTHDLLKTLGRPV